MNLDFCGGSGNARSLAIDSQECVNFYPEIHGEAIGKAKAPIVLIGTPGLKLFANLEPPPVVPHWKLVSYWTGNSTIVDSISGYNAVFTLPLYLGGSFSLTQYMGQANNSLKIPYCPELSFAPTDGFIIEGNFAATNSNVYLIGRQNTDNEIFDFSFHGH